LKLKSIIICLVITLLAQPAGVCLAPRAASTRQFPWLFKAGEELPDTMPGICFIPGIGPVIGLFDTRAIRNPLLLDPDLIDARMAIVRIDNVGICSSDKPNIIKDDDGEIQEPTVAGIPGGHEASATVVAIGPGVNQEEWLGQRVVLESHFPRLKDEKVGPSWSKPWHDPEIVTNRFDVAGYYGSTPGVWTQYALVPIDNLYPVSESIDQLLDQRANLLEPTGNAFYTISELSYILAAKNETREEEGEEVLDFEETKVVVMGLGPQGRMMARLLLARGMQVIAVDSDKGKVFNNVQHTEDLKYTELWLGDEEFEKKLENALDGEAHVIIDACGAKGISADWSKYLENDGIFVLFGLPNDDSELVPGTDIPVDDFVKKQNKEKVWLIDKFINYVGLCGRSPESWEWLISTLEDDEDDPVLARLMQTSITKETSLDRLAQLLYVYNNGSDDGLRTVLNKGKVVMRSGFSPDLVSAVNDLRDNPDSTRLSQILFSGKKELCFVDRDSLDLPSDRLEVLPLIGVVLPVEEDRRDPDGLAGAAETSP